MSRSYNRHAAHPVNAMLNYAYAVLESQVRTAAVAQGLDPTIGYLYACRPGQVALVYDLMEPLRPQTDGQVLSFVHSYACTSADFAQDINGVCRLHPQLVGQVTQIAMRAVRVEEVTESVVAALKRT
jgi:CRISPR-associated protein Cas1